MRGGTSWVVPRREPARPPRSFCRSCIGSATSGPNPAKGILSLILAPTRELAVQIEQAILEYGRFTRLRTLAVYGGVSIDGQFKALRRGVEILVATPGRLLDHIQRGTIVLKNVEVLVLDEADRMLDMGFINDVRRIVSLLPEKRQTMLFSATIPPEIKSLAAKIQKSPKVIQVGQQHNPIETITQHVYPVIKERKIELLIHLLQNQRMDCVLVFSRTKHGADKIQHRLERAGIGSVALHSGRNQNQRQRALEGFKNGKYPVLVATDIAARGIDVEGISHVINFDVPAFPEDYIHRIGRTGRATAAGDAITFVAPDEEKSLLRIQRFINRTFKPERCEDFDYSRPKPAPGQPTQKPRSDHGGHQTTQRPRSDHGGQQAAQSTPLRPRAGKRPRTVRTPDSDPPPVRFRDRKSRPVRQKSFRKQNADPSE